jgi:CMP-N,N'-diacetyllegionaminic acid synthase
MNVAIIPARCGSKSITNKNLCKLGGKSLVERAIESALDSRLFSKIILSTDIPMLIESYKDNPRVTLVERPAELAQDQTLMLDTVLDIIERAKLKEADIAFLLQPTSPFRCQQDYKDIMAMFLEEGTDSVISVSSVGPNHPNRMYTIKHNCIFPLRFTGFENKQDLPDIFIRSGHYYAFRVGPFTKQKTFFLKSCRPYVITRDRCVNIDEPFDLLVAKLLVMEGICR